MKMNCSPKKKIKNKIIRYIRFEIIIVSLPFFVNYIVSLGLHIQKENFYNYCTQLCVMIIALSATSGKCLCESKFLRKKNIHFFLKLSNIFIIVISMFLYVALLYVNLKEGEKGIEKNLFVMFIIMYIFSFALGLLIQMGDEI